MTVNRLLAYWSVLWLCFLVQGTLVIASGSNEDTLRARVEQCYNALEQGDWKKAEKYLTKESRPIFRNQGKRELIGYQIKSIKIDADGKTATVTVEVPVVSASAPKPILVPRPTRWRLVGHAWYMEVPRANASASAQQPLSGMGPKAINPSPSDPFSKDLKFESTWYGLGNVKDNEVKLARFPFTNISTHVVTLASVQLGCDCLRLKTQKMEYGPGESGTLEIEFDPSKLGITREVPFQQDILFRAEPGGAYVKLTVAALLLGPSPAPPAKP